MTRYYWRVLGTVQEPNTAVYFEEAINGTLYMLCIAYSAICSRRIRISRISLGLQKN